MIRKLMDHKTALSNAGLGILLVLGAAYLLVAIVGLNPFRQTFDITVNMDRSGGLQPRNDVTYNGVRVGKVTQIELVNGGIAARATIDKKYKIPMNGTVAVQALSAAGEQYIDFRPKSDEGPYLSDGSEVLQESVKTPAPISQVLTNASDLISSINPDNIKVIIDELDTATKGGPTQYKRLAGNLSQTVAGLDSIMPQTVSLVESLRVIAETTSHAQPDLQRITNNSGAILDAALRADDELRKLLDEAPGDTAAIGGVVSTLTDPITEVAAKLKVIGDKAALHEGAFSVLFPSINDAGDALQYPFWGNEFHVMLEPYTRPFCEYDNAVGNPVKQRPNDGRIFKWLYCNSNHNEIQVRGSANAPRPEGDDTAGPPPGYDPQELTVDLPR